MVQPLWHRVHHRNASCRCHTRVPDLTNAREHRRLVEDGLDEMT